ncbi:MAG TPA: hypothetical protein VF041_11465 [Gemmatimonadaceae bacterium]
MLVERDGQQPRIHPSAIIAESAVIVGNVTVGARCFVDHGVVVESSGAPVILEDEVIVLANSVVRSVGGRSRPPFPVHVGPRTLVAPGCVLTGCRVGARCYVATGVLVFHGADIGDGTRLAVGSIVHHHTRLPPESRVGLREIAVSDGAGVLCTGDTAAAREALARSDFFGRVLGEQVADQEELHDNVITRLLEELRGHVDRPAPNDGHEWG